MFELKYFNPEHDERVDVRPLDRSRPIGTSPRKGSGTLTRDGPGITTFIARRLFR